MAENYSYTQKLVHKVQALIVYQGIDLADEAAMQNSIEPIKQKYHLSPLDVLDDLLEEHGFTYVNRDEMTVLVKIGFLIAGNSLKFTEADSRVMKLKLTKIEYAFVDALYSAYIAESRANMLAAYNNLDRTIGEISFNVHPLTKEVEQKILQMFGLREKAIYRIDRIGGGHG